MNIFRFVADMLHLAAILLLLYRIKNTRNCVGKYKLETTASELLFISATNECRHFVQDSGNIPNRVLCALPRPIHVLRQFIQHVHEDFFHRSYSTYNLPDASQEAFLHYLRLSWRLIPPPKSAFASCSRTFFDNTCRRLVLGIRLVFFALARSTCVCAANRYAQQNKNRREHDQSLRSMSWTLPLFLHSQLVSSCFVPHISTNFVGIGFTDTKPKTFFAGRSSWPDQCRPCYM